MRSASLVVKNPKQFKADLEKEDKARVDAGETAAKVEGFRMSRDLKNELRQGKAGGKNITPKLSIIARKMKSRGQRQTIRKPLARMAIPIRYRTKKDNGRTLVQVGLVDPNRGAKLSKKWVRLGFVLQEGGQVPADKPLPVFPYKTLRETLVARGKELAKSHDPAAHFFFIKKSTALFNLPARPFIDMFWQANRLSAARNIAINFERKMRGERI